MGEARNFQTVGSSRSLGRALGVAAAIALAVTSAGCPSSDPPPPTVTFPDGSAPTTPHDLGLGLVVALPAGWTVDPLQTGATRRDDGCVTATGSLRAGDVRLAVRMADRRCPREPTRPLNGNHGSYVGIDDALEPVNITTRPAPAGTVTLFEQAYTECTNSCRTTTDRVALLQLDEPPEPDRPTVMLVTDADEVDADRLAQVVTAIHPS